MKDPDNKLSEDKRRAIKAKLIDQSHEAFDAMDASANMLSNRVFTINAGGAAAFLAFLGTGLGSPLAFLPLLFFAVGILSCITFSYAGYYGSKQIFYAAFERREKFSEVDSNIEDLGFENIKDELWYKISSMAVWVSIGSLIIGIITGIGTLVIRVITRIIS